MKITIRVHRDKIWEEDYLPIYLLAKKHKWRWQTIGALVSLIGGFVSPIIGTILNLLVSYTRWNYGKTTLNKVSICLYVVTIPLLLLGSHFLDLLEKKDLELRRSEIHAQEKRVELCLNPVDG